MSYSPPRLRMFAGPNGSGKSTIKSVISPELLGTYINPDEIEADIIRSGFFDFQRYVIQATAQELSEFFANSTLLRSAHLVDEARFLRLKEGKLEFHKVGVNAYFASVVADFLRNKLIEANRTFTFETVMSSPDKVEVLRKAQSREFRTYLYYVATEDPEINISRVCYRVKIGGHPVPEDKIISGYGRSLDLLMDAVRSTDRAYIFDNSSHDQVWLAEITNGRALEMKSDVMPIWFKKALWDKFEKESQTPAGA